MPFFYTTSASYVQSIVLHTGHSLLYFSHLRIHDVWKQWPHFIILVFVGSSQSTLVKQIEHSLVWYTFPGVLDVSQYLIPFNRTTSPHENKTIYDMTMNTSCLISPILFIYILFICFTLTSSVNSTRIHSPLTYDSAFVNASLSFFARPLLVKIHTSIL